MANYFSHDDNARNDSKIIKLRQSKDGLAKYGLFWMLIEKLADSPGYSLPIDFESIAWELRADQKLVKSVVEDFELFIISDERFFSESLNKRMEWKNIKSEKARNAANIRWNNADDKQGKSDSNANALQTHCNGNAIKGNKIKEKEIKETNTDHIDEIQIQNTLSPKKQKREKKPSHANGIEASKEVVELPGWLKIETWTNFLEHRVEIKAPMTVKAQRLMIEKLCGLCAETGESPEEIFNRSIMNGWKGIFPPDGNKKGKNNELNDSQRAMLNSFKRAD